MELGRWRFSDSAPQNKLKANTEIDYLNRAMLSFFFFYITISLGCVIWLPRAKEMWKNVVLLLFYRCRKLAHYIDSRSTMLVCYAKSVLDKKKSAFCWPNKPCWKCLEISITVKCAKCEPSLSILSVKENKCWWEKRRDVNTTNGI